MSEDFIDLKDIVSRIRQKWWIVAVGIISTLCLATVYLKIADRSYTVQLQVTPVAGEGMGRLGGLSNLASLAGVSVPSGQSEQKFKLYLSGLTSMEAASALASHPGFLQKVFWKEWSSSQRTWLHPQGTLVSIKAFVKSCLGMSTEYHQPDAARLQEFLAKKIKIKEEKDDPVVVISIETNRPEDGKYLLSMLHATVDQLLKKRMLMRTEEYISYLSGKANNIAISEHREALFEILSQQEKIRMAASSDLPFAAEPFGQPYTLIKPSSPNVFLVLSLALIIGAILGAALSLWLTSRQRAA